MNNSVAWSLIFKRAVYEVYLERCDRVWPGQYSSKIKYHRVNADTGKEVPYEKIVKGYQLKKEQYVVLDDHDFEEASLEKTKIIELERFVEIGQINPIYYETSYYTQPENQGKKANHLLLSAMVKAKNVGLARFVFRNTENLCVIHPMDGGIGHYQNQVCGRDP